jgi:precorrin-6A/cobalt-precorrin-6A reductase
MVGSNVLLIGGTKEAYEIAQDLQKFKSVSVITSLAGVTQSPRIPSGKVRHGGFGGAAGLLDYLIRERISLVVDATHPFAITITQNVAEAAQKAGIPNLHFSRRSWKKKTHDEWYEVESSKEAAKMLTHPDLQHAKNIFVTIGRSELNCFHPIKPKEFYVRSIEPIKGLDFFDNMRWIEGRGPFSYHDEYAFFQKHNIQCLVAKNSGGFASFPKINVARVLGVPVVLIKQPIILNLKKIYDKNELISSILKNLSVVRIS